MHIISIKSGAKEGANQGVANGHICIISCQVQRRARIDITNQGVANGLVQSSTRLRVGCDHVAAEGVLHVPEPARDALTYE